MKRGLLKDFLDYVEQSRLNLHGVLVTQNGALIGEHYWIRDTPHELRSVSKSFASCAIGVAIGEGRLSIDERVVDFFSKGVSTRNDEPILRLTVRNLLTMAHGRDEPIMMSHQRSLIEDTDWVRYFLTQPLDRSPGQRFVYDTGASYLLSAILQELTDVPLREYLMPRVFAPLGIDNPRWDICPQGRTLGGAGLHLTVRELSRFGRLLLQNGSWNGVELVPAAYLREATSKQIDTGQQTSGVDWTLGYGYQFWICRHGAFRADGTDGQFCIVIPRLSAVIAITAQERRMQDILDAVWKTVLPHL